MDAGRGLGRRGGSAGGLAIAVGGFALRRVRSGLCSMRPLAGLGWGSRRGRIAAPGAGARSGRDRWRGELARAEARSSLSELDRGAIRYPQSRLISFLKAAAPPRLVDLDHSGSGLSFSWRRRVAAGTRKPTLISTSSPVIPRSAFLERTQKRR